MSNLPIICSSGDAVVLSDTQVGHLRSFTFQASYTTSSRTYWTPGLLNIL